MLERLVSGIMIVSIMLVVGCGSGDDTRGVPAGIRPEDATFSYSVVSSSRSRLTVSLSRTSFCDRTAVTSGTEYVDVRVDVNLGAQVQPGTYSVETGSADVVLGKTSGDACDGAIGEGSNQGTVVLTTVTSDRVEGSFEGINRDTKLHLQGTFVAKPCLDPASVCLL